MIFGGFLKLSTQVTKTVLMIDSSDHVTGKTGLSAGITKYLTKQDGSATSATMTTSEIDSTNVKGAYRLTFTTSHTDTLGEFCLHLTGTGADPADYRFEVVTYLPGEAVTLQADQAVNTTKVGGTTQTARDLGASVLLAVGTGTGQVNLSSGKVPATVAASDVTGNVAADMQTIKTQTVTCAGGVTVPAGTLASTTNITAGTITTTTNLTTNNDKTGYGLSSAAVQAIWDALTSALTTVGSIGKWILDKLDVAVSTRGTGTGTALDAAGVRSAVGLASANLDTQLDAIPTNSDLSTALGTADDATLAAIAALHNLSTSDITTILNTAQTESYASDGATASPVQLLYMIWSLLAEAHQSSTTITAKKVDGATTSMTFTLDDAANPSTITRAS